MIITQCDSFVVVLMIDSYAICLFVEHRLIYLYVNRTGYVTMLLLNSYPFQHLRPNETLFTSSEVVHTERT